MVGMNARVRIMLGENVLMNVQMPVTYQYAQILILLNIDRRRCVKH